MATSQIFINYRSILNHYWCNTAWQSFKTFTLL